jgi:hypothetical protein
MQKLMDGDPWAKDANMDTRGFSPETLARLGLLNQEPDEIFEMEDKDGLNRIADLGPKNLRAMLQNPDPEMLEAMAERDPKLREQIAEKNAERISLAFRAKNPDYVRSARNSRTLIQTMAREHLLADHLDDNEAIRSLYASGKWTVETLNVAYKRLLNAGRLDVPKGTTRELTKEEKLRIIALLRTWDIESALMSYISYSLGPNAPTFDSPEGLLAAFPNLASDAALFVWFHSQADAIDRDQFRHFRRTKLAGRPMLTVDLIDRAWQAYQKELANPRVTPPVDTASPATGTRDHFDNLSDADFTALRLEAIAEYNKQHRR